MLCLDSPPVMWLMCIVYFHVIAHNSATKWSYGELHIYVEIAVALEYTTVQQLDYKSVF